MASWEDVRIEDVELGDELVVTRPDGAEVPRAVVVLERAPSRACGVAGWYVRVLGQQRPLWFPPGSRVSWRPRVN